MGKLRRFFNRGKQKESRVTLDTTTTATTTPESVPSFPDGVKVWVDPADAEIDVCFVHGLTGDRDATWTAPGQPKPWPSLFLPTELPRARLLTYGYDAYVVRKSVASINNLKDHATNLLIDLTNNRQLCNASSRRIIFVAHSLGGLICKKVILQSRNHLEIHLRDLFNSVVGIIFMGTPHTGSWMADWAKVPALALGVVKSTNRTLLEILEPNNEMLQSIQEDFLSMVREFRESNRPFQVTCFFEQLPLKISGRVVVTRASATFGDCLAASIHANHINMVKFGSAQDNGFTRLSSDLKRWAQLPPSDHQVASTTAHVGAVGNSPAMNYHQECLRSLSFIQMDNRFKDILRATKGTYEWLLEHAEYKKWAACDQSLLWIKGKPGSGKSTLLQYALSNARKNIEDGSLILSFFFHGRGVELERTPLGFFRSLLHQLLCHVPDSVSDLVTAFKNQYTSKGKPDIDWQWQPRELLGFLKSSLLTILGNRSVWLYVDALDECGEKNALDLVKYFKALLQETTSTNSRFHVCFTCRHYPILNLNYGFDICLDRENKKDISTYVEKQLSDHHMAPTIPIEMPQLISARASGVFLWARLVTERILDLEREGTTGWKDIAAEIDTIPNDLDDVYQDAVKSMANESSLRLMQWICFATRPLSLVELQWAMATHAKCTYQSLQECQNEMVDDNSMRRRVQTLSCGLVEVVMSSDNSIPLSDEGRAVSGRVAATSLSPDKGVVQFIHQSVKDFFVEKGLLILDKDAKSTESAIENAQYQLSRTCIRYFAMKDVGQSKDLGEDDLISKFPFLRYATISWPRHEKEIKWENVPQDLLDYFAWPSEERVKLWAQLRRILVSFDGFLTERIYMIHVASYYQLIKPLRAIVLEPGQINLKDFYRNTPLALAAEYGHQNVVQILLDTDKVDVDSKNNLNRTPLSYAAKNGHLAVVQLLLNTGKVDVDSKDLFHQTPLSYAAENGHLAVVQLLLNTCKVEANSKDNSNRTPLSYAAGSGHLAVVRILLDTGEVEVDSKDEFNWTPLWHAAKNGHQAIVQLLQEHHAALVASSCEQ
ncbi:nb-arc and ankyrin domain-containing protein [Xylaria scruposa]|nr:nb-arc and ankyrin domain-containing protein [Xylaria scruposa]